MITMVRSNMDSFREIHFEPGFNVVLADRTKESTKTDSRNGLGKTTLLDIIHFCLGSRPSRNKGLMVPALKGWSFTLDLNISGREITVTRSTDDHNRIIVDGDVKELAQQHGRLDGTLSLRTHEWNSVLGDLLFGLDMKEPLSKYRPTFRSLISYFVRPRDGFSSPFTHRGSQREWDKQVHNAFLLHLMWERAGQLQELKDEDNLLDAIRRGANEGLLERLVGSVANLEAERTRLESQIQRQYEILASFQVHPRYYEIEQEANQLTSTIQLLANANIADRRLIDLYENSLEAERGPDPTELLELYEEVGTTMPELVRRRLEEAQEFHQRIIANRKDFLQSEIQRIEEKRTQREIQIRDASDKRAELMGFLQSHGALEEYTRLQELHLNLIADRNDLDHRIADLRKFEQGKSEVRIKRERLLLTTRREFKERRIIREKALKLFNTNSQALYDVPGDLILNIADTGFKFDVKIIRSGSQGIDNMKIFCYDLMLAQLWASNDRSPGILIHDSTIFDGVDERQTAMALESAQREAEKYGFQYICAFNSDTLPWEDFSPSFDLDEFVRTRLTDESEEGGLLGIRF